MSRVPILHHETRLSPTPSSPSQILHISTTGQQRAQNGRKRNFDEISGLDEEAYARKHLAPEGSVFFRHKSRAPRSFLWRVLDSRRVVEVQCVDLVDEIGTKRNDTNLTFRLELPEEVTRGGVALADGQEADALEVFVLAGGQVYTFLLRRDLLARGDVPEGFDAGLCWKRYVSGALAFRQPYRMVAVSSLELLISLSDGGVLRMERKTSEGGAKWRETTFSEGGWKGTLRGFISLGRHHTVSHGELELDPSSATALMKSPDGRHIWTATLDHELKAWDTKTGKTILRMDLLGERPDKEGKQQQKFVMGAEQGTLLQVIKLPRPGEDSTVARIGADDRYYLVAHSPKDHQFKFWKVSSTYTSLEGEGLNLEDMQPAMALTPPVDELMNTNVWRLEEFHVQPGPDWQDTEIWLRARSGTLCKVFSLTFDLLNNSGDPADLKRLWQTGWTTVDPGMQTIDALRHYVDFPGDLEIMGESASTPTENWLDFVFYPGRFSTVCVETALHIYRRGRGLPASSTRGFSAPEQPLKQRLAQTMASKILLRRLPNDQPDHGGYQADIQAQWKVYYSLLSHLHNRRHDPISFAYDSEVGLPWSVCADFVAPIRSTSSFDTITINSHMLDEGRLDAIGPNIARDVFGSEEEIQISLLLAMAKDFHVGLSASLRESLRDTAIAAALEHEGGDSERNAEQLQNLYDSHKFHDEVMEDEFQALTDAAQPLGGLGGLDDSSFLALFGALDKDRHAVGTDDRKSSCRYGDKLTVAVAQETVERNRSILLDVLALVAFMYGDLDQADLHEDFTSGVGQVYDGIIARLKHAEVLLWLAKNEIEEPQVGRPDTKNQSKEVMSVPVWERIFIGDWAPRSHHTESMPKLLTMWSKQWTYQFPLFEQWDGITGFILSFLIKEKSYALAADFQQFISQGEDSPSWLRYLEGRLQIATGDYAMASLKFRAAAEGMSDVRTIDSTDPAHLLDAEERNYFGTGQSPYYQHVASLFEKPRIYSYVADFCTLALSHLDGATDDLHVSLRELDRKKSTSLSALEQTDNSTSELRILKSLAQRDELHMRLFTALSETGHYERAFTAAASISNPTLQRPALAKLIKLCVTNDAMPDLLGFPFRETDLLIEADAQLAALAHKSLETPTTGQPPYHQILYAFRSGHGDFRGAAEILYAFLQKLRSDESSSQVRDPEDETVVQVYCLLINTLVCCGEGEEWVLAEPVGKGARRLVTLGEVRKEYEVEMDRRNEVLQGRWAVTGGMI